MRIICLTLILLSILTPDARAQMDPSTALLLRRPSAAPPVDTLDEDHYSVRPARRAARPAPAIIITPAPSETLPPTPNPAPVARRTPVAPRAPAATDDDDTPFDEDALIVRVAAGYLNLDSNSSNPSRDYAGGGPGFGLGITLWATPTFGVRADYFSTVAAHVRDQRANYGLDHQEIDAALMYRRKLSTTLADLTVGYHEASNRVTRSSLAPLGTRSRGPDLGLNLSLPQSASYAHSAELHVQPYLSHGQLGGGTSSNTSYGGSLAIGGQYAVEHDRDWFWRLRYQFEQNAFARGATVTSGQALLILGVQWGS